MASYTAIRADSDDVHSRPGSSSSSSRGRRTPRGRKDVGHIGQASWVSSVINLLNTIVGAGILAMPSALSHMGIVLGVFVIIWAGMTSVFGLYLQTRCAKYLDRGTSSFAALSKLTYPNASIVFDTAIAIKCFGVGISYLIIIGDLMPGVAMGFSKHAGNVSFLVDRHFWITAFMLVVIPLSFLRRLDSLKYTSVIALISIAYLVILVLAHFIKGDTITERGEVRVFRWAGPVPALASFPIIIFAYTCHQNMFSILNEINNNTHSRTTGVAVASIGSGCALYILVAITGYLSYGDNIKGNIISMYAPSIASTIGKAAIVILVMFSYPLQVHPCRASIDAVLKWRPNRSRPSSADVSPPRAPLLGAAPQHPIHKHEMGELRFATITTIVIIASYVVAMTVSSLEKVLAYVGSTGSTAISFILPGLFYYKISAPDSIHHQRLLKEDDDEESEEDDSDPEGFATGLRGRLGLGHKSWRKTLLRRLSLALAIYGFVVMGVCLGTNTFLVASH
ncbi:hypothetical protein M501DRAFT_994085 [Patellaria atrata CBS 101060]|uniref:Amino acid transporter transmembrane domain-containing protein n=1 Tax=Patellaria atrata CBS 101060 TaxID=1346257 RepID=A0A9P4SHU9_9PEZI|nr:hypothetical protein M501DRAFT_994085 [Patellaria atrata CBS 101060]